MDENDISNLSKKERKKLKREMEQQEQVISVKRNTILKWSIIGVIILLVGFGAWWVIKESSKPLPGKIVGDQGRKHVSRVEWEKFKYNSNPPTSGPHDTEWIKKGIYDTPQGEGNLVHSLEHGYIILHYSCNVGSSKIKTQSVKLGTESAQLSDEIWNSQECNGFKKQLSDIAEKNKIWKLIVVPRPQLDAPIALTAWTRIDKMENVDKDRINRFIDAYRDHGPEQTMEP